MFAYLFDKPYYTYVEDIIPSEDYNTFFKSIHFKKEIGIFIYFLADDENYPIITIKSCNEETNLFEDYKHYSRIYINKTTFNSNAMLNDIIKLNDNNICYISCSKDKNYLIIVTLFFYDNDEHMTIRYYRYEMFGTYHIKFYKEIRGFYFNEYISIAFSHCSNNQCSEDTDQHKSSLIIFNYPNSPKDQSVDLIEYIYSTNNQIETFTFKLNQEISCHIDNNIFNYQCKGIKLISYPQDIKLLYKHNEQIIEKNSFLEMDKNLKVIFLNNDTYKGMNYTIEYAFVLQQPQFSDINNYIYMKDDAFASFSEQSYYFQKEYIGKSAFYNLTINEDMVSDCNDKCSLCYKNNTNFCTICKYNYTFNYIIFLSIF
jgi:hypothetical protein